MAIQKKLETPIYSVIESPSGSGQISGFVGGTFRVLGEVPVITSDPKPNFNPKITGAELVARKVEFPLSKDPESAKKSDFIVSGTRASRLAYLPEFIGKLG